MRKEDYFSTGTFYFHHNSSDVPSEEFILHCHAFYEIFHLIQGDVEYRIGGRKFSLLPGSILLIPQDIIHGVKINSSALYHRFSIHFLPEQIPEDIRISLLSPFHDEAIYYPRTAGYQIDHSYQSILECMKIKPGLQEIAISSRLIALLTQISRMHDATEAHEADYNPHVQEALSMISSASEGFSLKDIAEKCRISENHLNHLFKRYTGTTVKHYMQVKRLVQAQEALRDGMSASIVSDRFGWQDYSSFYRAYRKMFGVSPTTLAFREQELPPH